MSHTFFMTIHSFFHHPITWFLICSACLYLCAVLPVRIADPTTRKKTSWFVLVPVSLILILYGYPVGIELFRRLALIWR